MTVINTPSGTPTLIYSDPSMTVDTLEAAGTSYSDAAPIQRYSQNTVVLVYATGATWPGVILPSNAQIGDYVEIQPDIAYIAANSFYPYYVYDNSGNVVATGSGSGAGAFRKIDATHWNVIS